MASALLAKPVVGLRSSSLVAPRRARAVAPVRAMADSKAQVGVRIERWGVGPARLATRVVGPARRFWATKRAPHWTSSIRWFRGEPQGRREARSQTLGERQAAAAYHASPARQFERGTLGSSAGQHVHPAGPQHCGTKQPSINTQRRRQPSGACSAAWRHVASRLKTGWPCAALLSVQVIQPVNGDPFIGMLETPVTSSPLVAWYLSNLPAYRCVGKLAARAALRTCPPGHARRAAAAAAAELQKRQQICIGECRCSSSAVQAAAGGGTWRAGREWQPLVMWRGAARRQAVERSTCSERRVARAAQRCMLTIPHKHVPSPLLQHRRVPPAAWRGDWPGARLPAGGCSCGCVRSVVCCRRCSQRCCRRRRAAGSGAEQRRRRRYSAASGLASTRRSGGSC